MADQRVSGVSRREMLRLGSGLAGAAAVGALVPGVSAARALGAGFSRQAQQQPSNEERINGMRNMMASVPLETKKLRDNVYVIYNGGGNVLVLTGADGKLIVDTSVAPNAPKLMSALAAINSDKLEIAVNTHWHFDHTDGNGPIHDAGATLVGHENTLKRLSERQDIAGFGLYFDPVAEKARPQVTFSERQTISFDGEKVALGYVPPAHTDSDIYVHLQNANVLHGGDVLFNKRYPFIDASTGGSIGGMIAGTNQLLAIAGPDTILIPGHGPVGDKAAFTAYRDLLVTVRDRIKAQKTAGKTLQEVVASKPTAEFDAEWKNPNVPPDLFVTVVYSTL
jgi:cyclase